MDGRNSVGRRISLLNEDSAAPAPAPVNRLPSLEPGLRSRTSSYTSSPCLSPQTPQLLRSDSTDSAAMSSPSPTTPTFNYEESQSPNMSQLPYYIGPMPSVKQEQMMQQYPPMMQQAYAQHPQPSQVFIRPPGTERQPMPPTQPRTKKNQYPCPLASSFGCKDYFTTSGHAARHAKKHTGKKDAVCPDCRKAFTRKDNMEQHRRTHQNGRNARNASKTDDDSRVKKAKSAPRPKPSPIQSVQGQIQLASMVDPNLQISPRSSFSGAPAVQPIGDYVTSPYPDGMSYPPPEHFQLSPGSMQGTLGLEALALAAGGQRKFDA
ncbi:Zinc finger C2H2-type protein [Lasiodiplodia theobromae]|uniref:Biofilm and cell wall regulator 1 n=1 Tax=Lasiodiplodia theobromae TaxID=45133 RepID=A0A5N5DGI6_9PEZI|nr:Zinc finger C2H2-type protein [Lasiodiplodia theobromae]KAB2576084.1 Biofilm and cell wall regulator 1 [Lasiodiplodia theobromae]KAF4534343.1 Zinc finger C2H2-type protein [Lasiodiplodia theobromae]KAF9640092.1 Zinc finger C2H2-type protein [Lasiodiplodia theobromae]